MEINGYDYHAKQHWFLSTVSAWAVGYSIEDCLKRLRKADKDNLPHVKTKLPISIWRVPGADTTPYSIKNFAPRVEGAVFCGYANLAQPFGEETETTAEPRTPF